MLHKDSMKYDGIVDELNPLFNKQKLQCTYGTKHGGNSGCFENCIGV